jgi:hypothetical protein
VLLVSGGVLLCCLLWFSFSIRSVMRDSDGPMPAWFGYACGIAAILGMVSFAIFVTSAVSGLIHRGKKLTDHHDC